MSKDVCMDGPFDMEIIVHVTDGDEVEGKVTYAFPPGTIPTAEQIDDAIKQSLKGAQRTNPDLRLSTRQEFVRGKFAEKCGIPVAVPGPRDFPDAKRWDAA